MMLDGEINLGNWLSYQQMQNFTSLAMAWLATLYFVQVVFLSSRKMITYLYLHTSSHRALRAVCVITEKTQLIQMLTATSSE